MQSGGVALCGSASKGTIPSSYFFHPHNSLSLGNKRSLQWYEQIFYGLPNQTSVLGQLIDLHGQVPIMNAVNVMDM